VTDFLAKLITLITLGQLY